MAMYEYKVSRYKGTEVYRFHSVMEVAVFTGLTVQNIRTAVNNNKTVMGYRITRLDRRDKQKAIREYFKDAKKKNKVKKSKKQKKNEKILKREFEDHIIDGFGVDSFDDIRERFNS